MPSPVVPHPVPLVLGGVSRAADPDEIGLVADSSPAPAPALHDVRTFVRFSFLVHSVFLLLRFTYMWLDDVVRAEHGTFLPRLIEESTGAYGSFLLSGFVFLVWKRWPLATPRIQARLPGYVLFGVALSVANTTIMWASRAVIFPLTGLGAYDYGRMPLRYLMELPQALIGFATILAALGLVHGIHERRLRAEREAGLERALGAAQLQAVRTQLQPHFLFNALNTIAARVHDDPVQADALIGRLSELLRSSLRAHDAPQVPLREELALLDAYVDLMQARFGERLAVTIDVDAGLDEVPVPPLLLQPLVENAIRHGGLEREGHAKVGVRIVRAEGSSRGGLPDARDAVRGARLLITVHDDGPGMPAGRDPLNSGTGLSSSAQRLSLLHGVAASLAAGNAPAGGFAVRVTLPMGVG